MVTQSPALRGSSPIATQLLALRDLMEPLMMMMMIMIMIMASQQQARRG